MLEVIGVFVEVPSSLNVIRCCPARQFRSGGWIHNLRLFAFLKRRPELQPLPHNGAQNQKPACDNHRPSYDSKNFQGPATPLHNCLL